MLPICIINIIPGYLMRDEQPKKTSRLSGSLGAQVVLLIIVVTLASGICSWLIADRLNSNSTMHQISSNSIEVSQLIRMSIEKPMLIGDNKSTIAQFEFLSRTFPNLHTSLASFDGTITYSTNEPDIRKTIRQSFSNQELSAAYEKALKEETRHGELISLDGKTQYVQIASIKNDKSCHHCHGSAQRILGAMAVIKDVDADIRGLRRNSMLNLGISVTGGVAAAALLYAFMRRRVIRRILHMDESSNKIVAGDFNTRFTDSGQDELGRLTGNLNDMLEELKKLGIAQSVLKGMSVPSAMCDLEGRITFINGHFLDLLRHAEKPENALGTPLDEFVFGRPNPEAPHRVALKTKQAVLDSEETVADRQGKTLHLRFDASPVLSLEGDFIGVFLSLTDLTSIRENEKAVIAQSAMISDAATEADRVARELAAAAADLSGQVERTTSRAREQQDLSASSSSALDQMRVVLEETSRNTSKVAQNAQATRESAQNGAERARKVTGSMDSIVGATEDLKLRMKDLEQMTNNIGQVMQVIQDIADQTNLLALNAAIEAARAGDAGRGFAVVADEVRKLAEKTVQATQEVGNTIDRIKSSAQSSIDAVEKTAGLVVGGAGEVRLTGEDLGSILALAESVADGVQAVAAATEEQLATGEHLADSTKEVSALSARTAEAMAGSANTVRGLLSLAEELNTVIARMKENN